jgi:hypothetical protein
MTAMAHKFAVSLDIFGIIASNAICFVTFWFRCNTATFLSVGTDFVKERFANRVADNVVVINVTIYSIS